MERPGALQHRLSQFRWKRAQQVAGRLLSEDIGLTSDQFSPVSFDDGAAAWKTYIARVRARNDLILNWPRKDSDHVMNWLTSLSQRCGKQRVLWFTHEEEGIPVVVNVPLAPMLQRGMDIFVLRRHDLMLAGIEMASGLSLEMYPIGKDDEFELVAWGAFVAEEEGPHHMKNRS